MWPVGENELDTPDLEKERHRQTDREKERKRDFRITLTHEGQERR
jgi:hypothetical protein